MNCEGMVPDGPPVIVVSGATVSGRDPTVNLSSKEAAISCPPTSRTPLTDSRYVPCASGADGEIVTVLPASSYARLLVIAAPTSERNVTVSAVTDAGSRARPNRSVGFKVGASPSDSAAGAASWIQTGRGQADEAWRMSTRPSRKLPIAASI